MTSIPPTYNLGSLSITGTCTINSSSLLFPSESENILNRYFVEDISILTNNTEDGNLEAFSTKGRDFDYSNMTTEQKSELEGDRSSIARNILIKNLELQGLYNATIRFIWNHPVAVINIALFKVKLRESIYSYGL